MQMVVAGRLACRVVWSQLVHAFARAVLTMSSLTGHHFPGCRRKGGRPFRRSFMPAGAKDSKLCFSRHTAIRPGRFASGAAGIGAAR